MVEVSVAIAFSVLAVLLSLLYAYARSRGPRRRRSTSSTFSAQQSISPSSPSSSSAASSNSDHNANASPLVRLATALASRPRQAASRLLSRTPSSNANSSSSASSSANPYSHGACDASSASASAGFTVFADIYDSISKVQDALRSAGLGSSNLILAIDYTKSNEYTGSQSFDGRCLHQIDEDVPNPYQQVISIIGRTLAEFDEDQLIPTFGFGDIETKNTDAFSFNPSSSAPPYSVEGVLKRYNEITPNIVLSGPTNFAPVINKAVEIVQRKGSFHILVIIADGQVTNDIDTIDAIVNASHYPLSIIMVGVGDGPWDMMKQFDDELPQREFDNFQFVDFNRVKKVGKHGDASFACAALQEVPQQYQALRRLKMV
eukprot:CAMPEP_0177658152 /NCGR_PEP_ID=MMETSP0447-20121125/16641_1 /TAXON_ID=0 /ORGANISM="Stygamoeba regulata, Strain BSH-02190019" /LENGTH=373 /DNA_ID=CAMNT_0019162705 /DNA_START=55 /DNA_END=1176 /DNA_ORIENTATION=-